MHVVSDLQRRPNKARLQSEKLVIFMYGFLNIVQLSLFLVYTTRFVMARNRTFVDIAWWKGPLKLAPALAFKTATCSYNTRQDSLYGFESVDLSLNSRNINDIFADHITHLYLSIYFSVFALVIAVINRSAVEFNFFGFSWRNLNFRKDIISALEIAFLVILLHLSLTADVSGKLLRDYLRHCGVRLTVYLPFVTPAAMFAFVGVGFFSYFVGSCLYLWNTFPKYGIMTEEEIADYKVWLRDKRRNIDEAKRVAREALKMSKRLKMMVMMKTERMPYHRLSRASHSPESFCPDSAARGKAKH